MDRGAWQATVHGVTESDTTEILCTHNCENAKKAFLLGSFRAWQAVYRLHFRPHSPPGPAPFCSEPPTHPYIATLLNPSSREKPTCSLESWAPLLPLRKSRASKSWITLDDPRSGGTESAASHWRGEGVKLARTSLPWGRQVRGRLYSSHGAPHPTCRGRWRATATVSERAENKASPSADPQEWERARQAVDQGNLPGGGKPMRDGVSWTRLKLMWKDK